jgi:hypothetical protein
MNVQLVKPLAIVDNRTGHLMLLVDARTLESELEGGVPCQLTQDQGRVVLNISTQPTATSIGPFSKQEADKIRFCHRLTVAAFKDGIVTRAREVSLQPSSAEAIL